MLSEEQRTALARHLRARRPVEGGQNRLAGDIEVHGGSIEGLPEPRTHSRAGVLIPVIEYPGRHTVLLTERSKTLARHPGQVSFPGGRQDRADTTIVETALREAQEEVGIPPEDVEVLGRLAPYKTVTGYAVTAVVGVIKAPVRPVPDGREVADIFEVPLDFVLHPDNLKREARLFRGETRYYYAISYGERYIWGATAAMLVNFAGAVRDMLRRERKDL